MIKEQYSILTEELSVAVKNSLPADIRTKSIRRTGVRVYRDGLIGVAGFLGDDGREAAEKLAMESLGNRIAYLGTPSTQMLRHVKEARKIFTYEEFDAEIALLLSRLKKDFPQFILSSSGLTTGTQTVSLRNDAGLDLSCTITSHSIGLCYKMKDSANIIDGGIGYAGMAYDREAFLKDCSDTLSAHLNPVPLPEEGKLPVLFTNSGSAPLGIFAKQLAGRKFGEGGSLFSAKRGGQLFAKDFSLSASRDPEDGANFFDAEGTCAGNFLLIENGVLRSPYTDKKTALDFGLPLTGGAACAYDGTPSATYSLMQAVPSRKTIKELLGGEKAIVVVIASGGDFTDEGGFGTPVQLAFLYDNGKLVGRLPELQLSSGVYDMYGKDFMGVSSDAVMPLSTDRWMALRLNVKKL